MDHAPAGAVAESRRRRSAGESDLTFDEPLWTVEKVARLLSVKRA